MKYICTVEGKQYVIEINADGEIRLDDELLELDFQPVADQPVYSMILGGRSYQANLNEVDDGFEVLLRGRLYQVRVEDERQRRLRQASSIQVAKGADFQLQAPMPGLVVAVPVAEGQEVEEGDNLVILESMKMQNELRAPRAGMVTRINVRAGDSVDQKQILLTIE
jgi:acetyl/propionyl-CoA carboxylase alpha subunit